MQSGTVRNVIADHAEIHGSIRAFTTGDRDRIFQLLEECADEMAQKFGCSACVSENNSAPPVTNDENLFEELKSVVNDMKTLEAPEYIAEDFAWYQHYIPGVFMLLGTGSDTVLHTDNFIFDEDILELGVEAYRRIVMHKWII
jgi:hippurate hydrolase